MDNNVAYQHAHSKLVAAMDKAKKEELSLADSFVSEFVKDFMSKKGNQNRSLSDVSVAEVFRWLTID